MDKICKMCSVIFLTGNVFEPIKHDFRNHVGSDGKRKVRESWRGNGQSGRQGWIELVMKMDRVDDEDRYTGCFLISPCVFVVTGAKRFHN